jgi:hypothetical protein
MNLKHLPPYRITNYVTSPRNMSFESWLNSPVTYNDCTYNSILSGKEYTHQIFIQEFIRDLEQVIDKEGYGIIDGKQFKNEIATFIYRLSREPKYDRRN